MKKRIALVMMFVFMALTVFHVEAAFTDMEQTKYERAVTELEALKIIKGYEDGTYRPEGELTRAEFCALIINALGLEDATGTPEETGFTDVEPGHWAAGVICLAHSMGIIEGYGGGLFGPEDQVTYVQTLKMLLNSMGYEQMAASNGGFPDGYLILGASKLSRGVSTDADSVITRGEAAQLLYNALSVNLVEPNYGGGYQINYDKTLLSELMDRRGLTKKEGVVTGDQYTRLTSAKGLREGWLEIDGTAYQLGGISAAGLLGRCVTYYVQEDSAQAPEPTIYAIWSRPAKNSEVSIAPKDIAGIDSREISYFADPESERAEKAVLRDKPVTILNGGYIEGGPDDWKIKNGRLDLLDNDGDGIYDIVFVNSYTTYMVGAVNADKKEIGLRVFSDKGESRFEGKTCIEYWHSDVDITIEDLEGNPLGAGELKPYDVIAVYRGAEGKRISIVRAEGAVTGTVSEISEDQAVIGGKAYDIAYNNAGERIVALSPGEEGTFWLDTDGRITAKNVTSGEDYSHAVETIDEEVICSYIKKMVISSGVEQTVQVKVISNLKSGKREERVFTLRDEVTVDGEKMTAAEAVEALKANGGGSFNVPIRYELNGAGQIKTIDTFREAVTPDYRKYEKGSNSFDGLYSLTKDSIIYFVDIADYETVYGNTEVSLADGLKYYVKLFDPVGMDFAAENRIYIVYVNLAAAKAPETDLQKPMLVKAKQQFADSDGQTRTRVVGLVGGEEISLVLSEAAAEKEERISTGTLLRITKNGLGEIDDFKVLAALPLSSARRTGIGGVNEQVFGRALSIQSNSRYTSVILEIGYPKNGQEKTVSYEIADCPVYVFKQGTGEIEAGTTNDILTAQYSGTEASAVFAYVVNFEAAAVVVMK